MPEYIVVNRDSGGVHGPMPADLAARFRDRLLEGGYLVTTILAEPGVVPRLPMARDRLARLA